MSQKSEYQVCWDCGRERQRCKAVSVTEDGEIVWICRECYRNNDYNKFMHEQLAPKGYGHGV